MSYINEALQKAQKEKDTFYRKYRGIIETSGDRQTHHRPRWLIPTAIALLFLALTFVSWFKYHGSLMTDDAKRIEYQPVVKGKTAQSPGETVNISPAAPRSQEVEGLWREALNSQRGNNLTRAEMLYRKILVIQPDFVIALNNLGVIYMHRSLFEKAERAFTKAIKMKSDYVDPYYNLACIYSRTGALDKSLAYLKTAVGINSTVVNWAVNDKDLVNVRSSEQFKKIIDQHTGDAHMK